MKDYTLTRITIPGSKARDLPAEVIQWLSQVAGPGHLVDGQWNGPQWWDISSDRLDEFLELCRKHGIE